ncbi:MAG: NAD(P)H-binding protein, partial [Candidatus Limivivens sp.]|nr:NAD(P)H-binding protein [Candidatus Limivivens sp.]
MKRAIITGPTGAVGTALIEKLTQAEVEVTAVCRQNSKRIQNIKKSDLVKVVECDLDQLLSLKEKLNG